MSVQASNRLTALLAEGRRLNRKFLCPFLTAGYPSLDVSVDLLLAAQRASEHGHIGCIELGIPFSDPIADGPTIQASYTHALAAGVTVSAALNCVARARAAGLRLPVAAMVSFSIIFKRGAGAFAAACRAAGIDGIVLPDVPLEEAAAVVAALRDAGLCTSLLIAPTTPVDRRAAIARLCDGFVYYLSVSGITGERKDLPPDIAPNVAALRALTTAPICVGFGISTPQHVRQVLQQGGADGAIVGSALIRRITEHRNAPPEQLVAQVESLLRELAAGAA